MSKQIAWSEIEAECGDYRAGFVATFKKYEGQLTDEKDGQGRIVKVTMKSFARHTGIGETTFRRWVGQERRGGAVDPPRNRSAEALRDPEQRAKVLDSLSEDERLKVAEAALQPTRQRDEDRKRGRRATREEQSTDPSAAHYRMILLDLLKADGALQSAIHVAKDAGWSSEQTASLIDRIGATEGLLDILKSAVNNETDIDWDAELARLVVEESA